MEGDGKGGDYVGILTFISAILFIHGIIQILNPDLFLKIKAQGAMSSRSVRIGGFILVPLSIMMFLIDLMIE